MQTRKCEACKIEFSPKYRVKKRYWEGRRFCSDECRIKGMKGEGRSTKGVEKKTLKEKFWSKIIKGSESECWPWGGAVERFGYGIIKNINRTTATKAHRLSYELHKGPIPKGMCVCHSCDNPKCVNPAHLWLGTKAENNIDRTKKGRTADHNGENNPRAKITWKQRDEIEALVKSGKSQTEVAKLYGIAQVNVGQIILGKAWVRK